MLRLTMCQMGVYQGRCRLLFRPCEVNNLKEQAGKDTNILKVKYKQLLGVRHQTSCLASKELEFKPQDIVFS